MPSFFNLTLDTTGPAGVTANINSGAATTTSANVTLGIGTSDGSTSDYQMKVWGDVDAAADPNIQATEAASTWIAYSTTQAVKLASGNGTKTLNVKVRDDVYNESSVASDTINFDTTIPAVTVTSGPDVTRLSKIAGKRTASFSFSSDRAFDQYKVKVVPATNSPESAGTIIPTTNGSTNVSGAAGAAATPVAVQIDGRDLELASSGDGTKIVKVFVRDSVTGLWSTT